MQGEEKVQRRTSSLKRDDVYLPTYGNRVNDYDLTMYGDSGNGMT